MLSEATIATLRSNMRGELIEPGDARYDEARKVYNGMIDRRPRVIARCADVADEHELEHVPPQLNRGILVRRRMGESIGTDSLLGAGRCRGLIPGTCVSE